MNNYNKSQNDNMNNKPTVTKIYGELNEDLRLDLPKNQIRNEEFLFDEPEIWNQNIEDIKIDTSYIRKESVKLNPYAKRTQQIPSRKNKTKNNNNKRNAKPILYATTIIVCMFIICYIAVMMMPQLAGYFWKDFPNYAFINGEIMKYDSDIVSNYKKYREYLQRDVIYQGIFIDDVYVGNKTIEEAKELLSINDDSKPDIFSLTVNIGNMSWEFNSDDIENTRDVEAVISEAYSIGRTNTTDIIGTQKTPFRERVDVVTDLLTNHVYLYSSATYNHEDVLSKVEQIAQYLNRDPIDAQIESFDFSARTFSFTEDQPGINIDTEALYNQIIEKLDEGAVNETITFQPQVTTATVTKEQLESSFVMISAYTTNTTSSSNRNTNIDLACQAVNATVLMPGETFSFNATTGERTTAKGYKAAGAISAGEVIEEVGGGVCQVSSTLFNAVARADLEIVTRSPHAWPSTYVGIGEDATVDYGNLDFRFKNNKESPIFVIMYYSNKKCSAEIWGLTLGAGVTIELDSKIVKTIDPPSEVLYVNNPDLPAGASEQTIKARTGYVVDTYKVWYKDGTEIKREYSYSSTYKAYQRTIEYN